MYVLPFESSIESESLNSEFSIFAVLVNMVDVAFQFPEFSKSGACYSHCHSTRIITYVQRIIKQH